MESGRAERQRGQAAVEWVGAVVMIALLMGALSLVLAGTKAPARPPLDPIGALTPPTLEVVPPTIVGLRLIPEALAGARSAPGAGNELVGWLARASRRSLALGSDMGRAFGVGFGGRVRDRVREVLRSAPTAIAPPGPDMLAPGAALRDLVAAVSLDPAAVVDYVRRVRGLPPREAAVTVSADAGALTADAALEAAEFLVKRLIARGLYRTSNRRESGARR